jgi:hypothetical protein
MHVVDDDADVRRGRTRRGDGTAGEQRMNGCLAAKPLAPGTLVRPIGSQSKLSIGEVLRTELIHFDGRIYQLVRYPSLGGHTVWSPLAMLEIVSRDARDREQ